MTACSRLDCKEMDDRNLATLKKTGTGLGSDEVSAINMKAIT